MKTTILTILLLFSLASIAQNVRITVPSSGGGAYIPNTMSSLGAVPGDTLVLRSDYQWDYVALGGILGTPANPVVIINGGPGKQTIVRGFDFFDCQYVKVIGAGTDSISGFIVQDNNADRDNIGMNIHLKSQVFDVSRILFRNCNTGMWIKNESNCDTSVNSWKIDSVFVHDAIFEDMVNQGIYAGTTDANNDSRAITCNGNVYNYPPGRLTNSKFYNIITRRTGRAGIQVSVCQGTEIYNNHIREAGTGYDNQQGSGIAIGNYTSANIYSNNVARTYGYNISVLGAAGLISIESNTLDSAGRLYGQGSGFATAIVIDTRTTVPATQTTFSVKNNVIGWVQTTVGGFPDQGDIYLADQSGTMGETNFVCNNTRSAGGVASIFSKDGVVYSVPSDCGVVTPPQGYQRTYTDCKCARYKG